MQLNRHLFIVILSIVSLGARVSFSDAHTKNSKANRPEATRHTDDLTTAAYEKLLKEPKEEIVVLKFSATWCGPCQTLKPYFEKTAEKLAKHKDRIRFYEVDFDDEAAIVKAYKIKTVPALIVLRKSKTPPHGYEREGLISNVEPIKTELEKLAKQGLAGQ